MVFKKGNTYELKCTIKNGDLSDMKKIKFKFNDIEKVYQEGEESDITINDGILIIPFTQEETLTLSDVVEYEVAVKFQDDSVKRSYVKTTNSLRTIIKEVI